MKTRLNENLGISSKMFSNTGDSLNLMKVSFK